MTMNTSIKFYTDIEQAKALAEILPLESADMYYKYVLPKSTKIHHIPEIGSPIEALDWYNKGYTFSGKEALKMTEFCIPCWSLTALLAILPNEYNALTFVRGKYMCSTADYTANHGDGITLTTAEYDNPVDASCDLITGLHIRGIINNL